MNALTPFLVMGCIAVALLSIQLPKRWQGTPPESGRFASIDGLRGYLAFFVFLHHAEKWPGYIRTGAWSDTHRVFVHFGEISVLMFFMITGFLFMGKLIRADQRPVDWLQLFVGRVLRLAPLYAVAMVVLAVLVICATGLTLNQEQFEIARRAMHWMGFTIFNSPDINGLKNTRLIMSGVTWTLPYEWMFYLVLPAIALVLRQRVSWLLVAVCTLLAGIILIFNHRGMSLLAFVSGMATAWLVQSATFRQFSRGSSATVLVMVSLAVTVMGFDSSRQVIPVILVSTAFALIAAGNSLGGVLTAGTSRLLGECSYGIYLLHGFAIYITYRFLLGFETAARLSSTQHWLVMMACTPVVVLAAYFAFRLVEMPAMRKTKSLTEVLRRTPAPITTPAATS